jgi:hypothetical protein
MLCRHVLVAVAVAVAVALTCRRGQRPQSTRRERLELMRRLASWLVFRLIGLTLTTAREVVAVRVRVRVRVREGCVCAWLPTATWGLPMVGRDPGGEDDDEGAAGTGAG